MTSHTNNSKDWIDEVVLKPATWQLDDYVKARQTIQAKMNEQLIDGVLLALDNVGGENIAVRAFANNRREKLLAELKRGAAPKPSNQLINKEN